MIGTLSSFVSSLQSRLTSISESSTSSSSTSRSRKESRASAVYDMKQLPQYTLADVSEHYDTNDCWCIVNDYVYDVTDFLEEHPGGSFIMMEYAGRDATLVLAGSGHSQEAYDMLEKYLVGVLVPEERLYLSSRRNTGASLHSISSTDSSSGSSSSDDSDEDEHQYSSSPKPSMGL